MCRKIGSVEIEYMEMEWCVLRSYFHGISLIIYRLEICWGQDNPSNQEMLPLGDSLGYTVSMSCRPTFSFCFCYSQLFNQTRLCIRHLGFSSNCIDTHRRNILLTSGVRHGGRIRFPDIQFFFIFIINNKNNNK